MGVRKERDARLLPDLFVSKTSIFCSGHGLTPFIFILISLHTSSGYQVAQRYVSTSAVAFEWEENRIRTNRTMGVTTTTVLTFTSTSAAYSRCIGPSCKKSFTAPLLPVWKRETKRVRARGRLQYSEDASSARIVDDCFSLLSPNFLCSAVDTTAVDRLPRRLLPRPLRRHRCAALIPSTARAALALATDPVGGAAHAGN